MNIGELLEVLSHYPKEMKVLCAGPDVGGYDVEIGDNIIIFVGTSKETYGALGNNAPETFLVIQHDGCVE